ncbi:helix-turn-helix transcriptional regulator [Emcibacter sp. SYSU 3D8]|uniref:helix-turn-helix domain-containing protein n=1 Tax=Emcibacter sp. SYSU 3D8 TaxID=3133969 RepID=UPI0031FECEDB
MIGERIRELRKERGLTLQALGETCGLSVQQVHRLERGHRRLTVAMLEQICDGLQVDMFTVVRGTEKVPVLGVLDHEFLVHPLPPNSEVTVPAPFLGVDPRRLGAYRWQPRTRIANMMGQRIYFRRDVEGIDPAAWGHRSIITLADGTQRMGWLIRQDEHVHIGQTQGISELDVEPVWASKVLGVLPPDQTW